MSAKDPEPAGSRSFEQSLRSLPPDFDELAAALDRLPAAADRPRAALHLATPVDEVVGVGIWIADGAVYYRRHRLALPPDGDGGDGDGAGDDTDGTAEPDGPEQLTAITERGGRLALLGHEDGDRYLDLEPSRDPVLWCKPLVSGAQRRLFGSRLLLGGPEVTADPELAPAALFEALRRWLDDEDFRPPTVATLAGDSCLLDGSATRLHLR